MKKIIPLLLCLSYFFPVFAEDVAVVSFVKGEVTWSGPKSKKTGEALRINQVLKKGDKVTSKDGTCELQLATQATIRLAKFTEASLEDLLNPKSRQSTVKVYTGKLFVKAHKNNKAQNKLNIVSPSLVAGVRGTEFIVAAPSGPEEDSDLDLREGVYVNEGTVAVVPDKKGKEVLTGANEEVTLDGATLKKQILNEYAKEKMKIFEQFKQLKEENYQLIKEQYQKNEDLMNEMKGKN
ncbi:iron dicitrate transporter FecR [Leptospira kobayashii]|uniref:Iron dicitrate transporter FecR n=1 Tax=Leptospira kobayashii TaxID=1917830 RepID=A0ABN6KI36_9LEPT|nr:FecR family protein [Leptospira kobayashii]BDA79619.1 iron dicitrate transporter FecR [Leptospira kobayashii]